MDRLPPQKMRVDAMIWGLLHSANFASPRLYIAQPALAVESARPLPKSHVQPEKAMADSRSLRHK